MPDLQLSYKGKELSCGIAKVDRRKLYGYTETEVVDSETGQVCSLATLAADGRTLIPAGGVALAYVSPKGLWKTKEELKAVDLEGNELKPVASTFKERVELKEKASAEEYLDHNIRMVYQLESEHGFPEALVTELEKGTIYRFPFSYRGGLVPDEAFILRGKDGTIWMAVGKKTDVRLIGQEQIGAAVMEEESDDEEVDPLDFGMM